MGKNNRQRRAAKARNRSRTGTRHARGNARSASSGWDTRFTPADRFVAAVLAERSGDAPSVQRAIGLLAAEAPAVVAGQVAPLLEREVAVAWRLGWQPADVARAVARELGSAEQELARRVVAAQAAGYERLGAEAAPAWMAQLEANGMQRDWAPGQHYLLQAAGPWPDVLLAAVRLMELLGRVPRIPLLMDPPEAWHPGTGVLAGAAGSLPPSVLATVRALLAKAESTTFDAEAEAFTAKAQELMARHRIDRALLDAGSDRPAEPPAGRRIGVDDPYADAKAALLANIADANGCHAVWSRQLGFTTVFGFAGELDAVEELFTSLLVQATAALRREGSKQDRYGRSRTTRFRRSFLVAFAARIGQRLRDTVEATVGAAGSEHGASLLPALAARDEAARAAADAAYPDMGEFAPRASDREGWYAGTLFGDQADLGHSPELTRRPA